MMIEPELLHQWGSGSDLKATILATIVASSRSSKPLSHYNQFTMRCQRRRMGRLMVFILFILGLPFPSPSTGCAADKRVRANWLVEGLPDNARSALAIIGLEDRDECHVEGNHQGPLVPGSLAKLLVAGAAFDTQNRSGGKLNLKTRVSFDGDVQRGILSGNLYLQGSGNAFLSLDDLRTALIRKGVKEIAGHIIVDESSLIMTGLERGRKGPAYAPPGALGLDLHTASVTVQPTRPGEPPRAFIEPHNSEVQFAISARTVQDGPTTLLIDQLDDHTYKVMGNISQLNTERKKRFSLHIPALFAGQVFKTLLQDAGIIVRGAVEMGKTPEMTKLLFEVPGPDLESLLREMNFHSLNVVADNLLLSLGAESHGVPGTREKGIQAVKEFLSGLNIASTEIEIYDGSGLSANNKTTAEFIARFLSEVSKEPWFEQFKSTLPKAGSEGTVRNLSFSDERFRIKTGRLEDVYALAGYGVDGRGKDVSFSFIVNGPGIGIQPGMDEIGKSVLMSIASGILY